MLLHNEQAALPPGKLQEKITALLRDRPDMAEAVNITNFLLFTAESNATAGSVENSILIIFLM